MNYLRRLIGILCCCTAVLGTSEAFAKKNKLSPAKIKQYKKTTASYESCRKQAVTQLKQGSISQKKFEIALRQCKENFPGADLYINCKRSAIKTAKSKNIAPDKAVKQCKRYMIAASFDENDPLPFFVEAGKVFFAGVGLNQQSIPVASIDPPNFDCGALKGLSRNPEKSQFLLFGNYPGKFAGLSELEGPALQKKLGIKRPSKDGTFVEGLGKVLGNPKDKSSVVFFPSASCDFDSELGKLFAGISTYYLIDAASSAVTPYFGIAYFKQSQKKISTQKAIQGMVRALGGTFKTFPKGNNVTFIAADNLTETDDEQDPKNLCEQPRVHRFVGVVQGRRDDPKEPEYFIIANVKNLCEFGDRLGKRMTK